MIVLGQNIYLWRFLKGLSQEELAKKAGLPRPNLAMIESGKREPSLSTLRSLALSLGIDPGALVNGATPVNFRDSFLSRKAQEKISKASVGQDVKGLSAEQKIISSMLSNVIRNKINAGGNKFSKKLLKDRQLYIRNWLMLKAALKPDLLNKLLAQIDKYIQYLYESKADQ